MVWGELHKPVSFMQLRTHTAHTEQITYISTSCTLYALTDDEVVVSPLPHSDRSKALCGGTEVKVGSC